MSFKFMFVGCIGMDFYCPVGAALQKHNPVAIIWQGDVPYIWDKSHQWQTGVTPVVLGSQPVGGTVQQIKDRWTEFFANPGVATLLAHGGRHYHQFDDHELLGDNWDFTVTNANAGMSTQKGLTKDGGTTLPSQEDVNTHWSRAKQAWREMLTANGFDNPAAGSSGEAGQFPQRVTVDDDYEDTGNKPTDPEVDWATEYYTVAWDVSGNFIEANPTTFSGVHVLTIHIDCVSYKHPVGFANGPTKTLLGTVQKAWLKNQLDAAEAGGVPFKVICSGKSIYDNAATDSFDSSFQPDEQDELLNFMQTHARGVIWVNSDEHRVRVLRKTTGSPAQYPASFTTGPTGRDAASPVPTSVGTVLYDWPAAWGSEHELHRAYGIVEVGSTQLRVLIMTPASDKVYTEWTLDAGTNVPVHVGSHAKALLNVPVADTSYAALSFTAQTDVGLGATITSNSQTISGVNVGLPVTVSAGTYQITRAGVALGYTSSPGVVYEGDQVTVRHTASASWSTAVVTTLTVNGVAATFTSTTVAQDTTPASYDFVNKTNVALDTVIEWDPVTITGLNSPATITISGSGSPQFKVTAGGSWGTTGTVSNNEAVYVRHTSSADPVTQVSSTITIGGVQDTFASTTTGGMDTFQSDAFQSDAFQ